MDPRSKRRGHGIRKKKQTRAEDRGRERRIRKATIIQKGEDGGEDISVTDESQLILGVKSGRGWADVVSVCRSSVLPSTHGPLLSPCTHLHLTVYIPASL